MFSQVFQLVSQRFKETNRHTDRETQSDELTDRCIDTYMQMNRVTCTDKQTVGKWTVSHTDRQFIVVTYTESESLTSLMTVPRVESPSQFPKADLKNKR